MKSKGYNATLPEFNSFILIRQWTFFTDYYHGVFSSCLGHSVSPQGDYTEIIINVS